MNIRVEKRSYKLDNNYIEIIFIERFEDIKKQFERLYLLVISNGIQSG